MATGCALLPWSSSTSVFAAIPGGTLDPATIDKYVLPLVIPPAMPITSTTPRYDFYRIAVRQFQQQILPAGLPKTTVWSYGSQGMPGSFNYPAFTVEAKYNREVRVRWVNELVDATGNYLPHLLTVDPTLHWANPPGGVSGRDSRPDFTDTPRPYTGPVPIVTHLHGGHSTQENDGFAEAWFLPNALNIPPGYATTGTYFDIFRQSSPVGSQWGPGQVVFQYFNDQRATTCWYHDHTLGMTRVNVYAGPAGFYLIRGGPDDLPPGVLPGPAPSVGSNPFGTFYEIPIAIQDRSFNADGSLFYAPNRAFFDGFGGPYIPFSDISPFHNPEFFGNTMVVNGRTWPFLNVEQRRYRFRFLNGCNSRFLVLKFDDPRLDLWQIGSEGGFLPAPVRINDLNVGGLGGVLLMGLAERADVIADFTNVPVGTTITLLNLGPDEPFGGFPTPVSEPNTTGQVMQFRVVSATSVDMSTPPRHLVLPALTPLGAATNIRQVSLNEEDSAVLAGVGPRAALLGTVSFDAMRHPVANHLGWDDPITENPTLGATEVWEMYNFTEDAHPIHIHEAMFQVVNRQRMDRKRTRAPEAWETGFKDTVIAYPSEITRVKAKFDRAGLFVWHCHIVEHEDNEMMRPYRISP
jgi:spore coat protein A, manganese oxidase